MISVIIAIILVVMSMAFFIHIQNEIVDLRTNNKLLEIKYSTLESSHTELMIDTNNLSSKNSILLKERNEARHYAEVYREKYKEEAAKVKMLIQLDPVDKFEQLLASDIDIR